MKILIVGLGNPGDKFKDTRHNAGFKTLDAITPVFRFPAFNFQPRFNAEISENMIGGKKVILAKPQTFMNASGNTVKTAANYYKIKSENIIVIHDDLDIPIGEYKVSKNRSSAGHKGVQSIIDVLGMQDFTRVRIGIGVKNKKIPTERFVLENFTKEEQKIIDGIIEKICGEIITPIILPTSAKSDS